eukprot:366262-Chlamydomonas_euryale.AAC.6
MASEEARQRYARKNEQDELERAFRTIDKDGDARIDAEELNQLFKALGHKVGAAAAVRSGSGSSSSSSSSRAGASERGATPTILENKASAVDGSRQGTGVVGEQAPAKGVDGGWGEYLRGTHACCTKCVQHGCDRYCWPCHVASRGARRAGADSPPGSAAVPTKHSRRRGGIKRGRAGGAEGARGQGRPTQPQ